jgi:hypothetical protein
MPQHISNFATSDHLEVITKALGQQRLETFPHYRAHMNLKYALSGFQNGDTYTERRLYLSGEEWLNSQTPNVGPIVIDKLVAGQISSADSIHQINASDKTYLQSLMTSKIDMNSFPFEFTSTPSASHNDLGVEGTSIKGIQNTAKKNFDILNALKSQLEPSLDPNDAMIFQTWDINNSNIMRPANTPINIIAFDGQDQRGFKGTPQTYNSKRNRNAKPFLSSGNGPYNPGKAYARYVFK